MTSASGIQTASIPSFSEGFTLPLRAVRLLLRHRGLKRFALLPLLFNILVYAGAVALFFYLISRWDVEVAWEFWGPTGGWLSTAVNYSSGALKWLVALPVVFLASYFSFTIVGMVVAVPLSDMLSERVERTVCEPGDEIKRPPGVVARLLVVGIIDALIIVLKQLVAMILVLPLLLIPVVGFLPMMLVLAYFTGLGFFDIPMARNGLERRHKKAGFRSRRWALLGLGLSMELLFLIPFAGLLVLPLGTVAGTLLYCDGDWKREFKAAGLDRPRWFAPPRRRTRG